MASFGKFGKGATKPAAAPAKAAGKPAKKAPAERVSKYANAEEQEARDPIPVIGVYRFRVIDCTDEPSPKNRTISWFKATLEILAIDDDSVEALRTHNVGDEVTFLQQTAGNGADAGIPRVVSFVRAAAGYETYEEYKEFDPKGYFVDAVGGIANEYSEAELTIVGRVVDCKVTRGRDRQDGSDYYRNYEWSVVDDDDDDQALPKLELAS